MLVGDLVQAIREAVTDQPQTFQAPGLVATPTTGGVFPAGPYFLVATIINQWGETTASAEVPVTLSGPNNAFLVSVSSPGTTPASTVKFRIYIGTASGQQNDYTDFPYAGAALSNAVVTSVIDQSVPPSRNTAYNPNTDGDAISAGSLFRWINDSLRLASQVCGGLLDYGGISTVSGVPQYITPGQWKKISSLWYDGYPLAMDDAGNFFRRNSITASILASVATSLFTDRMMLEVWPQPSRSAASTTLAAPLAVTDTQAVLTSAAGFLLTNGFVNINGELMSYSTIQGNILKNLIHGLGGSTPVAQLAGAPVNELNMFWQGWRKYAPVFKPGDSLLTVPVPVGWETQLFKYGLGRAKLAEQGLGDYTKLEADFIKSMKELFPSNAVSTGPRQIGEQTDGLQVLPNLGGGWVIP